MKETDISRAIISDYFENLLNHLENDVVIVGAGPAGLTAAYYLAKTGKKTIVIEKKLAIGGGIWGGASAYNSIVVEDTEILDEIQVNTIKRDDLYIANAVEFACALGYRAKQAGAEIFNLVEVEDVVIKQNRLCGAVLNATAIRQCGLHVDPFCVSSKALIDGTGHPAEVVNMVKRRGADICPEGIGEGFMDVDNAEKGVVEKAGSVYPGLYVTGMSVAATYNLPRMGPIFGGMLKSGKKIAQIVNEKL